MNNVGEGASVSVIIPTYNRASVLAKVLPSYLQFDCVCQILVIDDGSRDGTAEIGESYEGLDARVQFIRHPRNLGRIVARNTGIGFADGDLVLFSEDDLALSPDSLDVLVVHMEQNEADIISGRRIWMRIGETKEAALTRANSRRLPVVNRRLLEHHSHAVTHTDIVAPLVDATMLVRREVVKKVQWANCYPGNAWREESDFQLAAQQLGFKVVFCPHAHFYHYDRAMAGRGHSRLKSDLVYLHWIYRNNLTFLRRHHDFLRHEIPEALILDSPFLTNLVYSTYRTALLTQTEVRRAILSRRQKTEGSR